LNAGASSEVDSETVAQRALTTSGAPTRKSPEETMNAAQYETDTKRTIVLVGIDFLALSKEVLVHAAELAVTAGSELHVVHVLPHDDVMSVQGERAIGVVNLAKDAQIRLEELAAGVPAAVTRIFLHLAAGKPDVEIAQLATDLGADLIVVGTRGRTGIDRLVNGSVAENLLRLAPCPVLVFRPKSVPAWEQIDPPCPDCLEVQRNTNRAQLWCDRHSQHHPRAHTYTEAPEAFGMGSLTFR
jgi:nucleotide-binding universal stress UspA family protein